MNSLIKLIQKGKIPLHQFMDMDTINWIKENKPSFNINTSFKINLKSEIDEYISEINNYVPSLDWFLILKKKDTIHGMRHILRVIFNSLLLVSLSDIKAPNLLKTSLIAASLHDLRRQNDLRDLNHGKRAAKWFINNISLIEDQYAIQLSQEEIDEIYYAILFHDLPYKKIVENKFYKNCKTLTNILKTADALDRYRLPSLRLWFKNRLVSIIPPDFLKFIAYQLVILSEIKYLNGETNVYSVLEAIKELNKLELKISELK